LLPDEVSSSVDDPTDALIQQIIRSEFANYTVITVAHRLDTIMDYDRVVTMDQGQIKECGDPKWILNGSSIHLT
jgi:ATP-binding cassette subfamily C (CFTR/MRP) protein 1